MAKFKFVRKKNKFIWTNDYVRVIFSEPQITPTSTKVLHTENEIMYYYYNVKVQKRRSHTDKQKWYDILKVRTWESPFILEIKDMLNSILNDSMEDDCQIYRNKDNSVRCKQKVYRCDSLFYDDYYSIERVKWVSEDYEDNYTIEIGKATELEDITATTIVIPNINKSEIEDFLLCIERFVQYSLDDFNSNLKNDFEKESINKQVLGNLLITFDDVVEPSVSVYCINDIVDIHYWKQDVLHEEHNKTLSYIYIGDIELEGKDDPICEKDIYYITTDVSDEKLHYKEDEIVSDFVKTVLSQSDVLLDYFKTHTVKEIVKKYPRIICNRYWMYRNEHGFKLEDVPKIEKQIIKQIKKQL